MSITHGTKGISDSEKLSLIKLGYGDFRLKPVFATAPAASKNYACFECGQK